MATRKDTTKGWVVDFTMSYPDGNRARIRERSPVQSRRGAEAYERELRQQELDRWIARAHGVEVERKEVPTFAVWWSGRFWRERVIGQRNSRSERQAKECIYRCHLEQRFGSLPLDEIVWGGHVADFRATLAEMVEAEDLSVKRANNVLTPLGTALKYAVECRVLEWAPRVGLFKLERPEIEWWELEQYARLLEGARRLEPCWNVAVHLAGEAGLRVGEIRALVWERDVDLIGETLTISRQVRQGVEGPPKGRKRRTIPMTSTLHEALRGLSVVRRGFVARNEDGSALRDGQTTHAIYRVCRKAGLPERSWHVVRHTYGTHAAMFGVNPWRLMAWMGHKRIDETMRYVHVAEGHQRPLPEALLTAGAVETDPDRRVLAMLGARSRHHNGTARKRESQPGGN